MKKFKTILASLFMILATAFISACSCSGDGSGVVIYEQDIDIRCVTENVNPEKDEESGIVTVHAHLGDTFGIEYNISPNDVTYTEVNWSMSEKGYVEPTMRDWTRSKSTKEVVEFKAVARKGGTQDTEITITFKTRHERVATCRVYVYDRREKIPTYAVPNGVDFNPETNTLSWNPVNVVYNAQGGELSDSKYFEKMSYEISKKNLLTDEEPFKYVTNKTSYSGVNEVIGGETIKDEILPGVPYEFSVRAVGDSHVVLPSDYSTSFKFYKLDKVTEVKNNDGKISFKPSENAAKFDIHYFGYKTTNHPHTISTAAGSSKVEFDHTSLRDWESKPEYDIQVQAFPAQYSTELKYAVKDGVRYYPSDVTDKFNIKKLADPTITTESVKAPFVLAGKEFTAHSTSVIKLSVGRFVGAGQRFAYDVFDKETGLSVYNNGERETLRGEYEANLKLSDILSGEDFNVVSTGKTFVLKARTVGDDNTIASNKISNQTIDVEFSVLSHLDVSNSNVANDLLNINSVFTNKGAQIFAIYQSANAADVIKNSKYFELPSEMSNLQANRSYNFIDEIAGLPVGTYKLYATALPLIDINEDRDSDSVRHLMILPEAQDFAPICEVEISGQVQNVKMSNDGILSFDPAQGDVSPGGRDYLVYLSRQQGTNPKSEYAPVKVTGTHYDDTQRRVIVDIRDILAEVKSNPKMTYDGCFGGEANVYIEIIACGGVNNEKTIINSSKTTALHIKRLAFSGNNNMRILNHELVFDPVGTNQNQKYRIELLVKDSSNAENTYTSNDIACSPNANTGAIHFDLLATDMSMGAPVYKDGSAFTEGKSFIELLDASGSNTFYVTAIGAGGGPKEATLDSTQASQTFFFTSVPTNVQFDAEGMLTWSSLKFKVDSDIFKDAKTQEDVQAIADTYQYAINFYTVEFDEHGNVSQEILLDNETMFAQPQFVFDAETSKVTEVSLKADVSEVVIENAGKVISVEVIENITGLFTNTASARAYATKLGAPVLSYSGEENYGVAWTSVDNATLYDLTIIQNIGGAETPYEGEDATNIANADRFFSVTDKMAAAEGTWGVGSYIFAVMAKGNANSGVSAGAPYIIPSDNSAEIVVNIIDNRININVENTKITFNNIFKDIENVEDNAGYSIYKDETIPVAITETSIQGKEILTIDATQTYDTTPDNLTDNEVDDVFKVGTNDLEITPYVTYATTGYIIKNTTHYTSISKLEAPTNLAAISGNLVFRVAGSSAANAEDIVVEVFKGDTHTPLAGYTYTVAKVEGQDYFEVTVNLDSVKDEGALTLSARIQVPGKLQSEISAPFTATKIATVKDLTVKNIQNIDGSYSQWLVWSASKGITSIELGWAKFANSVITDNASIPLKVEEQSDGSYVTIGNIVVNVGGTASVVEVRSDDDTIYDNTTGKTYGAVVNEIFKYDNDEKAFYFNFQYAAFLGTYTGDSVFTVKHLTSEGEGQYFNSSTSAITDTIVTKLNNATEISVSENGVVVIGDYVQNGTAAPQYYSVNIYKVTSTGEGENIQTTKDLKHSIPVVTGTKGMIIDLNTIDACLESCEYAVEVQYFTDVNTENIVASDIASSAATFTKLATTTITTQSGEIAWANVAGATDYTLEIREVNTMTNSMGQPIYFNISLEESNGKTILTGNNIQLAWQEIEADDEGNDDSEEEPIEPASADGLFVFQLNHVYILRVKANAKTSKGSDVNKLHSIWSEEFQVMKLEAPTNVQVVSYDVKTPADGDTPAEVASRKPVIAWTPNNRTNTMLPFELYYSTMEDENYNPNIGNIAALKVNATASPLYNYAVYELANNLPVGDCVITLRQMGNTMETNSGMGILTSDFESITIKYITETNSVTISDGVVTWKEIAGAFSYRVDVYSKADYDVNKTNSVPVWTTYTATESLDLARVNITGIDNYYGAYVFVVRVALIDVNAGGIVTSATPEDFNEANTLNIFKPNAFEKFRVKDGNFSWRVPLKDVKGYAQIVGLEPAMIIKYVYNTLNGFVEEGIVIDDPSIISHLLEVELVINGTKFVDKATSVNVIKDTITYDEETQTYTTTEEVVNPDMYEDQGESIKYYLEYVYDMDMAPEYTNPIVPPEAPEDPGTEEPDPEEPAPGDDEIEPESISPYEEEPVNEKYYPAREYVVKVSPMGQKAPSEYAATNIINGVYSAAITAHKPNTPRTWTANNADISEGKVQWELSTTNKLIEVKDENGEPVLNNGQPVCKFDFYKDYRITAYADGQVAAYTDVTVAEKDPNILASGYQYYRNLKNDLFVADYVDVMPTNYLVQNTNYTLQIQTRGTADSSAPGFSGDIYINSNACIFNEEANILGVSQDVAIENNEMRWVTSNGSTATKVYIYGPFDNLNEGQTAISDQWLDYMDLNALSFENRNSQDMTDEELFDEDILQRVITLADVEGVRETVYTITDQILNGKEFAAGGYVFRLQEIGNRNGIVDSPISINYYANKLAQVSPQTGGWIGTSSHVVYEWSGSTWQVKDYTGQTEIKLGSFVWNPVAGANAYKVQLFRHADDDTAVEAVDNPFYTRETVYEVPTGPKYPVTDANGTLYRYLVRVIAVHLTTVTQDNVDVEILSPNYFTSDFTDSTAHLRLETPEGMTLTSIGMLKWNGGSVPTTHIIGKFRVRINSGATFETVSNQPYFSLQDQLLSAGNLRLDIKALPGTDKDTQGLYYISSNYCDPRFVTKLADPTVRLEQGVFTWSTKSGDVASDPLTATKLTIDGKTSEVFTVGSGEDLQFITSYNYFTDITQHDGSYNIDTELRTYPVDSHTFKAQFKGSIENGEVLLVDGETYYIASEEKPLEAIKLANPVVENVQIEYAGASTNMVAWNPIANAEGYRVRVFFTNTTYEDLIISTAELKNIDPQHEYFGADVDGENITKVYLKLSADKFTSLIDGNGAEYNIYVQAIGSGLAESAYPGNGQLYLSSSYSNPTTIGIPPTPTNFKFVDTTNGVISWDVNATGVYNIKLVTRYNVDGVSQADYENYWVKTSDNRTAEAIRSYSEIVYRYTDVTPVESDGVTTYNLTVEDTIQLLASGKTPTSYKLTNIGYNYTFELTAIAFVGDDNNFKSETYIHGQPFTFTPFGKGDGSETYKYTVYDYTTLTNIQYYMDRDFVITDDISFTSQSNQGAAINKSWKTVEGTFSGSIDGQGNTLKSVGLDSVGIGNSATIALFETVSGTIENLNIELRNGGVQFAAGYDGGINVATVAINNRGTISNVHVAGNINITAGVTDGNIGTSVAGLVLENRGEINNSSFEGNIVALDNGTAAAYTAGIATYNYGTIGRVHFTGSIKSNQIGGITTVNYGAIDRSYVDNASLYVTDEKYTAAGGGKTCVAGGISAQIDAKKTIASITNSYSKAKIYITNKSSSGNPNIGGLVASVSSSTSGNAEPQITISGCYVVTDIVASDIATGVTTSISCFIKKYDGNVDPAIATSDNYFYIAAQPENVTTNTREGNGVEKVDSLVDLYNKLNASIYDRNNGTLL